MRVPRLLWSWGLPDTHTGPGNYAHFSWSIPNSEQYLNYKPSEFSWTECVSITSIQLKAQTISSTCTASLMSLQSSQSPRNLRASPTLISMNGLALRFAEFHELNAAHSSFSVMSSIWKAPSPSVPAFLKAAFRELVDKMRRWCSGFCTEKSDTWGGSVG